MSDDETVKWEDAYVSSVKESGRKDLNNPILYTGKWFARRLMTPFDYAFGRLQRIGILPDSLTSTKGWDGVSGGGTIPFAMARRGMSVVSSDINPIPVDLQISARNLIFHHEEIEVLLSKTIGIVEDRIGHLYRAEGEGIPSGSFQRYTYYLASRWCSQCSAITNPECQGIICRHHTKSGGLVVCPSCEEMQEVDDFSYVCSMCKANNNAESPDYGSCGICGDGYKPNSKHRIEYVPRWAQWYSTESKSRGYSKVTRTSEIEIEEMLPRIMIDSGGYNSQQIFSHGFREWKDLLLERQRILFSTLNHVIWEELDTDKANKVTLAVLMRTLLEYNSVLCEPKGLGTGHIRHAFHHHILHPKPLVVEPTPFSLGRQSGSFNTIQMKFKRAKEEISSPKMMTKDGREPVTHLPWDAPAVSAMQIIVGAAEEMSTEVEDKSLDIAAFDIPYFDSVMYDELSNYFRLVRTPNSENEKHWKKVDLSSAVSKGDSDANAEEWMESISAIFRQVNKKLSPTGRLLVSYHHSKDIAWEALYKAVNQSGFVLEDWFPIWAEMGTSSSHSNNPIRIDLMMTFRKTSAAEMTTPSNPSSWIERIESRQQSPSWSTIKSLNENEISCINQILGFFDENKKELPLDAQFSQSPL